MRNGPSKGQRALYWLTYRPTRQWFYDISAATGIGPGGSTPGFWLGWASNTVIDSVPAVP